VQVPLADYLAHVEPEVAKELHDFTRLRDGGLTLDETKLSGLGERSAIADPLQLVRGSGGMEPMFQIGDRKLTLEAKGPEIDAKTGVIGSDQFRILDETGKKVGFLEATAREGGTKVYIDNIGGLEAQGFGPNSFGPALTRSLLAQIKSAYPNVKEIGGFRISGARERAGTTGPATIKVQSGDAIDAITHEHFRNLLSQNWEDLHAGVSALFESEGKGLASDTPMGRIVLNELRRIVPDAGRDVAHDISVDGVGNPRGVFFPNLRQIVVSLNNRDPIGTARHEAIHALKKMGMFSDAEWASLEKASQGDWVKRFSVAERWGKYEGANFIEEGIAEAYQHWANGGTFDKAHATLFQRIKDFFEGDVAVLDEGQCACGRGLPLLKEVRGRSNDVLLAEDGTMVHDVAIAMVLRSMAGVNGFKVIQETLQHCRLQLVTDERFQSPTSETKMRDTVRSRLGAGVRLDIEYVDAIEPERTGKYRYVVSKVSKHQAGQQAGL